MNTQTDISIALATRNRAASLARLFDGLAAQANAPPFEVIIGDNGSSDDTIDVIERVRDRLQIRYVYEERPGKSRALNNALKLAQSELIVFTDDDVQPYPNWIAQLYAASIIYSDCNVFGGQIEVNLEAVPRWIKRSHNLMALLTATHRYGDSDTRYSYGQYPFGPNMAIRHHLLTGLDSPYPEHLGPGTRMLVGDEHTFLSQFSPPNATDRIFVANARVMHEVESESVNFNGALNRCYLAGRTYGMLGIPYTAQDINSPVSTLTLILQRMRSCQSLRELICISARYIGYLQGYHMNRQKGGN
ncbi:MAG: glycosyltransferase family A protein [Desulfobacterales bacterium]